MENQEQNFELSEKITRFHRELGELRTIPKRQDLIIKLLGKATFGLTKDEKTIIATEIDKGIILSLCKAVEKHEKKIGKALQKLEKENPKLFEKIKYVKTARDKAIAHLDNAEKIEKLNNQGNLLGTSPLEVKESYKEIIEWILKVIDFKGFVRQYDEVYTRGLLKQEIDNRSDYEIFEEIILVVEFIEMNGSTKE